MASGPNLVAINDIEFTDQGRTFDEERDERAVTVELASGKIKKYIKSEKRTWDIRYTWLPQTSAQTYDGKSARDDLKSTAFTGNTVNLKVKNVAGGTDSYTAFVESYDEKLIKRDYFENIFFYDVSIQLKEQ